ncbi:MAG: tetratricopeptide repeat protein [Rikenellaceae bacterium]|nr:tetratricopeptide repeat protein [Rikenellaceae bacterium]
MPERGLVRKGNRLFAKERYEHSSNAYREALQHDSTSFEARYDLANALIRMAMADTTAYANPEGSAAKMSSGNLQQAEALLQAAAADSLQTAENRAEAYYNLGNAQFVQQKLQDALQSYRRSLVLNPDDMEAKYNYALTKKLLEQNQQNDQNQQNNDQNQNQNQDQNQNQNQNQPQGGDDNKDKNDQNDDNQDQNQDQNKDNQQGGGDENEDKKEQPQQPKQPPKSGMSEEQQQQLLNAIQAQEDKTQDKLDEKAKGVIIKGKKNW